MPVTGTRTAEDTPVRETRRGVLLPLVRPVARTVPWWALAAGGGLGLLAAAVPRLSGGEVTPWAGMNALRAAALCFALGAAFLLDDPARQTTAAVPVRRVLRHALRCGLLLPVAAAWWTTAVLLVPQEARPRPGPSPWRRRRPLPSPWPARPTRYAAGAPTGRARRSPRPCW